MSAVSSALARLAEEPGQHSRGGVDVVAVRAEPRDSGEDEFVYVMVELKAPRDRDAWPVQDVRDVRRSLRELAERSGISERVVVTFIAEPGTGDADAIPEAAAPPAGKS